MNLELHTVKFQISRQKKLGHLKDGVRPKRVSEHFFEKSDHAFQTESHSRRFSVEGDHEDVNEFDLEKKIFAWPHFFPITKK